MKVLVVRFSSIGDIVLTTPVLRAIKEQRPDVELHYLTKKSFVSILESNPHVDKIHGMEKSLSDVLPQLKLENFDLVVDLHNNLRTRILYLKLRKKTVRFPKLNWQKWLLVKFKLNRMPDLHVVDRYYQAVTSLGIKNLHQSCVFPIDNKQEVNIENEFGLQSGAYVAVVIGAKFATKQLPKEQLIEIINGVSLPVILVGGKEDVELAEQLTNILGSKVQNACGKYNLQGSASILKNAAKVLTNDTGMMHIASSYSVPIVSVWGNTVPELGMFPYRPDQPESYSIHEVKDLSCRPCSKIGYAKCPKGHFNCMRKQNIQQIIDDLN